VNPLLVLRRGGSARPAPRRAPSGTRALAAAP